MEKAKRKASPEVAQKQITRILFLVLVLSVLIFFFPLVWLDSPIKPPLQSYVLVPLLSIPLAIFYGSRFGIRKRDYILIGFCLAVAILLLISLEPCQEGCGGGSSYYLAGESRVTFYTGCAKIYFCTLF